MNEETRMVERAAYLDGEPCWVDVLAADMEAAKRFYGAVFGWTFEAAGPEFGHYTRAKVNGRAVAGISPPPPGAGPSPGAWSLYLASHDLDGIGRLVDGSDGKVLLGPMDIPGNGRMLFATDPTGAAFGVFEPGGHSGCQLYAEPGAPCWAELNTRGPQSADAFYRSLFDYEQRQLGDLDQLDYTTWSLGGQNVCGRLKMTANWTGIAPHWMVYFAVADADRAAERAHHAGGQVQHDPFDSAHGRIAVLADPNGAVFGIMS